MPQRRNAHAGQGLRRFGSVAAWRVRDPLRAAAPPPSSPQRRFACGARVPGGRCGVAARFHPAGQRPRRPLRPRASARPRHRQNPAPGDAPGPPKGGGHPRPATASLRTRAAPSRALPVPRGRPRPSAAATAPVSRSPPESPRPPDVRAGRTPVAGDSARRMTRRSRPLGTTGGCRRRGRP